MRSVNIEKTAAVRTKVFDQLQCRDRSLSDRLGSAFDRSRGRVWLEIHRHTLRDQHQTAQDRHWQQDPKYGANQVPPKISNCCTPLSRATANESNPDIRACFTA